MTPTMAFVLTFFGLGGTILGLWRYANWRLKRAFDQPYPKGPLEPEVIRVVGGCGVTGCPNSRPHSHVGDLARRLKDKR